MTNRPERISAEEVIAELLPFGSSPEERRSRHDAFWGGLSDQEKTAARVACDCFSFASEANRFIYLTGEYRDSDPDKSINAFNSAITCAKVVMHKLRLFARLLGCHDAQETAEKLNRLIAHSRATDWQIYPNWWLKDPTKSTVYFICKFNELACSEPMATEEEKSDSEGDGRKPKDAKPKRSGKKAKGGAK